MALSSHPPLQKKKITLFVNFALFLLPLSNGVTSDQRTEHFIECSAAPSFFPSKIWIKLIPKTIGNRKKRLCVRLRLGDKHHPTRKICRLQSTNQEGFRSAHDLCFAICRFSQVVFIPRVQPRAQSLFLFPIVFGIHFLTRHQRLVSTPMCQGFKYDLLCRKFKQFYRSHFDLISPLILQICHSKLTRGRQ